MTQWVVVQDIYLKMHAVPCTNIHYDVTDLVNQGMVKNTKTWISWERDTSFQQNQKNYITRVPDDTFWEVIVV